MSKDLFKSAIAEAKSVREAAIANAKEALEETLTPHLKDMLTAKLQEMEAAEQEEVEEAKHQEEMDEAQGNIDAHDENPADQLEEEEHEEKMEEAEDHDLDEELEAILREAEEDESEESEDESEEEEEEAEEEEAEEAEESDDDVSDLSVEEFKDLIRDIISQELDSADHGHDGESEEEVLDAGDIEGMGEEPIEEPVEDSEEEEIDLDELLNELTSEDSVEEAKEEEVEEQVEEGDSKEEELKEALETIEALRTELQEVNLLNSKLLYVNKLFKSNNLSESQKVSVITAFDKAETVKEVKLVFETVSESIIGRKENVSESKGTFGMASKATGTTAKKPEVISEANEAVIRMQKLAGIIK